MAFMAWINMGTNNPLLLGTLAGIGALEVDNLGIPHLVPRGVIVIFYKGVVDGISLISLD